MSDKVYRTQKGTKKKTWSSKRSKISNRRPPNRHSMEKESESVSTAAKKLKLSKDDYDIEVNESFGYRLINFVTVFSAFSEIVVCKQCGTNVKFTEASKRGLGFKLVITCEGCEKVYVNSCPIINKASYEVNRRIIFAMRLLGIGLNGIIKFCAFMDLPRPIFQTTYDIIVDNILVATEAVRTKCIKKAAENEKTISEEKGQMNGITVSGDGSWRKRGFSSLYGLVTLIGWFTGKIVDVLVKSKYCKACEFWMTKENTEEYQEWAESHSEQCEANHKGSSGKMEVDAVVEMFSRSENLHNMKYVNYIGDGDSKTFKGIVDAQPYEDITICKKECIDHVQKRMGTRLRNLKKTKNLGGKGKLTGKLIDELSVYYGLAIRRNPDSVEKMRNDIWATLFHKLLTDEVPQHDKCPNGVDSWCSWQRAKALGTLYEYQHKTPLSQQIFDAVKPIYEDLSRDDLLNRCLGGFTQNSNESFNSMVWSIAPKTLSSGKKIVDIATNIATCIFNDGLSSIMAIMEVLQLTVGHNCHNFCVETDARRVKAAERSRTDAAKDARRASTSFRKEEQEKNIDVEGQLYGAGIAE